MRKGRGLLIVVSGPSGTGKGTVLKAFAKMNPDIVPVPSATTRAPREGEVNSVNYFFKTREEFEKMIEENKFVEWVVYCDNYYGTPIESLEERLSGGFDVVLEKEVEGALKIKETYPESVIVFIAPPSMKELRKRIEKRGTEDTTTIEQRLKRAVEEMKYLKEYDYVIINDDVEKAAQSLCCLVSTEKLRVSRNSEIIRLGGFL